MAKTIKSEPPKNNQRERFTEAARQLECDDDKERFEERLKKIAKAKSKGVRGAEK